MACALSLLISTNVRIFYWKDLLSTVRRFGSFIRLLSENITVRKVKMQSHGYNNDGCDPESCRNVLIEDCDFDTGDDCIAIKSGRDEDGRYWNIPSGEIL